MKPTHNPHAAQVQTWLKALKKAGLTSEDIARETGISRTSVNKYIKSAQARTIKGAIVTAVRTLHERIVVRGEQLLPQARRAAPPLPVSASDAFAQAAAWQGAVTYESLPVSTRARVDALYASCMADIRARLISMHLQMIETARDEQDSLP